MRGMTFGGSAAMAGYGDIEYAPSVTSCDFSRLGGGGSGVFRRMSGTLLPAYETVSAVPPSGNPRQRGDVVSRVRFRVAGASRNRLPDATGFRAVAAAAARRAFAAHVARPAPRRSPAGRGARSWRGSRSISVSATGRASRACVPADAALPLGTVRAGADRRLDRWNFARSSTRRA